MNNRPHDFTNLLHIYALDVGEKTFPMELYWSCKDSDNNASLVNPVGIDELIGRHEKYMQMHGWTYEDLKNFGKSRKYCVRSQISLLETVKF